MAEKVRPGGSIPWLVGSAGRAPQKPAGVSSGPG